MKCSNSQTVLITGALGCIGRATARWLLAHSDVRLVLFSRKMNTQVAAATLGRADESRWVAEPGDVTDRDAMASVLTRHAVSHVVHLAGLQTPDCNEHRDLGLQVNLAGTQQLIEAIKSLPNHETIRSFVYASSSAVYAARSNYTEAKLSPQSRVDPVNVYGIWKYAAELVAKLFHVDTRIPTVSIRPAILFGPGRDLGLSAAVTTAMKCVARGTPYTIPFTSTLDYQYAPDVGAAFGVTVLRPPDGYHVFNTPSWTVPMDEVVRSIERAAAELGIADQCQITIGTDEAPFAYDFDFQSFLEHYPNVQQTPFDQAVRESIEEFRQSNHPA